MKMYKIEVYEYQYSRATRQYEHQMSHLHFEPLLELYIEINKSTRDLTYMIKKIIQPYEGRPLTDITKQSVISTLLYELQEYGLRNMEYDSNFADAEIKMYPMFDIQIYYIGDNGLKQIDLYTEID